MKCETCGYTQHYCSSCESDVYLENGFCDEECWEKSDRYKRNKKMIDEFLNSLNDEQKKMFTNLEENCNIEIDLFGYRWD